MPKIVVAGSRSFKDFDLLKQKLDSIFSNFKNEEIEIVCGEATGADLLGKKYAIEKGYKVKSFPAYWNLYNRAAGPIRNNEMAQYSTHCVIFWDGKSAGSRNMIDCCNKYNLPVRVIQFNNTKK